MALPICDVLLNRRTIRNYDPDYVIPKEQLTKIMEAVRVSPTSYGIQDLDFLVCTNKQKNQEAADAALAGLDEGVRQHLLSRRETFKVSNVITCDASAEVIIYRNERAKDSADLHAGIATMAICCAAKEFGLDTMCHAVMVGKGCEKVYGLPEGSSIMAVAIGKAKPDAHLPERKQLNKVTYIE